VPAQPPGQEPVQEIDVVTVGISAGHRQSLVRVDRAKHIGRMHDEQTEAVEVMVGQPVNAVVDRVVGGGGFEVAETQLACCVSMLYAVPHPPGHFEPQGNFAVTVGIVFGQPHGLESVLSKMHSARTQVPQTSAVVVTVGQAGSAEEAAANRHLVSLVSMPLS